MGPTVSENDGHIPSVFGYRSIALGTRPNYPTVPPSRADMPRSKRDPRNIYVGFKRFYRPTDAWRAMRDHMQHALIENDLVHL